MIKSIEAFLQGGSWGGTVSARALLCLKRKHFLGPQPVAAGWGEHRTTESHRPSCPASCWQGRAPPWDGERGREDAALERHQPPKLNSGHGLTSPWFFSFLRVACG